MFGAVCCMFPVLLANFFTPMLIATSYAGHIKTVIIRCISETVSLHNTLLWWSKISYMFRLCKTTIIRPCISEVQNFVLLQYEAWWWYFMYFWNMKPDDDWNMWCFSITVIMCCTDRLFRWYMCTDTTGWTHSKTLIIILIVVFFGNEN
jgi:hypothetical protein